MSKADTVSLDNFSAEAKALVAKAQTFADTNRHRQYEPAHLLAVLLDVSEVAQVMRDLGVNLTSFNYQLHGYIGKFSKGSDDTSSLAPSMIELIARTKLIAANRQATVFDLLLATSQEKQGVPAALWKQFDLTPDKFRAILTPTKSQERNIDGCSYLTNLTALAKKSKFDTIIGRDNEVRRLIQILGRQSKNHPLLVGEHGVGKRTIVMALVDRIQHNNIPKMFRDVVVVQLNISSLLSGTKSRTEVEERMRSVCNTLQGYNAIVYVRSIETLLVQTLNLNIGDLLGMLFAQDNLRVVSSCTAEGLKKITEKDSAIVKEYTVLNVEPTTVEGAVEVLRGVAPRYEKHHGIKIGEAAINTAVKLAKRYVADKYLPESAIDLVDEACSNAMMGVNGCPLKLDKAKSRLASVKAQLSGLLGDDDDTSNKARSMLERELKALGLLVSEHRHAEAESEETTLGEEAIALVLGSWTGIPVSKFMEGEAEKLGKMEAKLGRRVVGQDDAVKAISKAVRRSYLGLRDIGKPIGSFLFLGSSGVGKTEIAKALAEFLFDDETAMCRIDASEYREAHQAQKLIGATVGYEGSQDGGMLTEFVRKKPYCVILMDEIEKAHGDVWNLMLQTLDDGRLTDGRGRTTDFSNTIILMTSNIGSKKILEADPSIFQSEEGFGALKEMLQKEMTNFLRPELINRLNDIVIFRSLGHEQLAGILDIQLRNLNKMLAEREITVKVSDEAKKELVRISYEPAFGARPLKRAITKHIQDTIAEELMKGSYGKGTKVYVSFSSGNFILET